MILYSLTTQAQSDLDEIAFYIASEASVDRAVGVLEDLRKEFSRLSEMPCIGHYRDDLLSHDYRFWSVHSYVIAYRWNSQPIVVVAVLHGARDLGVVLSDRLS